MNKFIEITDGKRRYINVRHIESIEEVSEKKCIIYMLPNWFNNDMRAYYVVDKSYDEVVEMVNGCKRSDTLSEKEKT